MMRVFSFLMFVLFSAETLAADLRVVTLGQVDGVAHLVIDPNTGVVFGHGTAGGFAILLRKAIQTLV